MARNWKPSKTQAREFAYKMANDEDFKNAYLAKKEAKDIKRRAASKFDYQTAGGSYVPTKAQNDKAMELLSKEGLSAELGATCRQISYGYSTKNKIDHDHIHIINEIIRSHQ